MMYLNDLYALLPVITEWVQTPDGCNTLFALICAGALAGLPTRLCLLLTLVLHASLIFV